MWQPFQTIEGSQATQILSKPANHKVIPDVALGSSVPEWATILWIWLFWEREIEKGRKRAARNAMSSPAVLGLF